MGRKRLSEAERVRRLVESGHSTKYIVDHVGCKPQVVYSMRYYINKKKSLQVAGGIGALPIPLKPKRKYTRRSDAGTGINAPVPDKFIGASISYLAPQPTLWERIKGFFRG